MDRPGLDPAAHHAALKGLARINAVSGVVRRLDDAITDVARTLDRPVRVLELACGGGDTAAGLVRRAAGRIGTPADGPTGLRGLHYTGFDLSPTAVGQAQVRLSLLVLSPVVGDRAAESIQVFIRQADVLIDPLPEADIVFCSLFVHHLDGPDIVTLLTRMREAAARRVIVDDLRRSRAGVWLAHVGCRLLTRSPIVHFDGPVSVEGALTPGELRDLAAQAGMEGVTIRPYWPQRMLMTWDGPA